MATCFSTASFGFFSLRNHAMDRTLAQITGGAPRCKGLMTLRGRMLVAALLTEPWATNAAGRAGSNHAEDVRAKDVEILLELGYIEEAQGGGDRGEQRVSILRRVAEAGHFPRARHGQRR